MTQPTLIVKSDFDGSFERLVRRWMEMKEVPFQHSKIVITSGPYRPSAVSYKSKDGVLQLDFYSAIRAGFGGLSGQDVTELVALL